MSRVMHIRKNGAAYLALFFALCGTSYGAAASLLPKNSVTSAQVVNGSLKKADLSASAVAALHGAGGSSGPQGIQGPQGPPANAEHRAFRASRGSRASRGPRGRSVSSTTSGR